MKKFINGRWFPLAVVSVVVLIFAFVLFLCGFRITYAPELENSWDAISACAAWAGAIGSVAAVFSAIYVANRQNKIALFEKRYQIYTSIFKIMQVTEKIWSVGSSDISNTLHFFDSFCSSPKNFSMNLHVQNRAEERQRIIDAVLVDTEKIAMLFKGIANQNVEILRKVLIYLITVVVSSCPPDKIKDQITKEDWENIQRTLDKMEEQLHL